jgi:hypothetical protein
LCGLHAIERVVFANPSWQKGRILFTQIHRNANTTSRIGGYTQQLVTRDDGATAALP